MILLSGLNDIAKAIAADKPVYWDNFGYKIIPDANMPLGFGVYYAKNQYYSPLTESDLRQRIFITGEETSA